MFQIRFTPCIGFKLVLLNSFLSIFAEIWTVLLSFSFWYFHWMSSYSWSFAFLVSLQWSQLASAPYTSLSCSGTNRQLPATSDLLQYTIATTNCIALRAYRFFPLLWACTQMCCCFSAYYEELNHDTTSAWVSAKASDLPANADDLFIVFLHVRWR